MLEPDNRSLFLAALRPPLGYKFDIGVGTTYSLDLLSLLTVPLAFAFSDWEDIEGENTKEPLAILKAVREYSDRIALFCQAGKISVPSKYQVLYVNIEPNVFECTTPNLDGHFHPKVWMLRYTNDEQNVMYKVVCATRNLTFDLSWDAMVVLEGELIDRQKGITVCRPLVDFLEELPKMTIRSMPPVWQENLKKIKDEIRKVKFTIPEEFEDIHFWPMGINGYNKTPFDGDIRRFLIMSPFLDEQTLKVLSDAKSDDILISKIDTLCKMDPKALNHFNKIYSLNPAADPEPVELSNDDEIPEYNESYTEIVEQNALAVQGLHAKLYIADAGWDSRVWVGSANATTAGLERNVEFMVELVGKKSICGIDTFLSQEKYRTNLIDLLTEFHPDPIDYKPEDVEAKRQELLLDKVAQNLAKLNFQAFVEKSELQDEFHIKLALTSNFNLNLPKNVSVVTWPISLNRTNAIPLTGEPLKPAVFNKVSLQSLTSFFAFEVSIIKEAVIQPKKFVLTIPLNGAPSDRRERILNTILSDREQVLRFLLLLLGSPQELRASQFVGAPHDRGEPNGRTGLFISTAFFESLVRALVQNPESLDSVHKVIEDLRINPNAKDLIPIGLEDIWPAVWKARQELQG